MPKPTSNTRNVLRWIFGIPLAFAITVGALFLVAWQGDLRFYFHNYYLYMVLNETEIVVVFALPVFLSCLFAPSPKKYAALIAMVIVIIFIMVSLYYLFAVSERDYYQSVSVMNIAAYLGFFAGASLGFALSYLVFKNKGWNRELPELEMPEDF